MNNKLSIIRFLEQKEGLFLQIHISTFGIQIQNGISKKLWCEPRLKQQEWIALPTFRAKICLLGISSNSQRHWVILQWRKRSFKRCLYMSCWGSILGSEDCIWSKFSSGFVQNMRWRWRDKELLWCCGSVPHWPGDAWGKLQFGALCIPPNWKNDSILCSSIAFAKYDF